MTKLQCVPRKKNGILGENENFYLNVAPTRGVVWGQFFYQNAGKALHGIWDHKKLNSVGRK